MRLYLIVTLVIFVVVGGVNLVQAAAVYDKDRRVERLGCAIGAAVFLLMVAWAAGLLAAGVGE